LEHHSANQFLKAATNLNVVQPKLFQASRQDDEIRQLQRAGIPTAAAEALLDRMLNKIDGLCAERNRLKKEQPSPFKGRALGERRWCP
jgi:hypothetical protein